MRAIVILCLLHAAFLENNGNTNPFSWNGARQSGQPADDGVLEACVTDKSGCGCCLMKTNLNRMKEFFNMNTEGLMKYLNQSKTVINSMRDDRSGFSVALNDDQNLTCHGPFVNNTFIAYERVYLNWGNGYNNNTGVFTVPRSGVYSFAATIYSTNSSGHTENTCANLQVNNVTTELHEKHSGDPEDSNTVVIAVQLGAGDQVAVNLQQGCIICDNENHYNTFTGFLVFATDEVS